MAEKNRKVLNSNKGAVHILATFNNTIVNITDSAGNTLCWATCGNVGFKGSRKSTPYAASIACDKAAKKAIEMGLRDVEVYIKGPGLGRVTAVKALKAAGLNISAITDLTQVPHNGCRPKNRRRI